MLSTAFNQTWSLRATLRSSHRFDLIKMLVWSCVFGLLFLVPYTSKAQMPVASWTESVESSGRQVSKPWFKTGMARLNQNISLSLHEATLEESLQKISREAKIEISYGKYSELTTTRVTLEADQITVLEALYEVTRETRLGLKMAPSGRVLVVPRAGVAPRRTSSIPSEAPPAELPDHAVSGRVTSQEDGLPIPGVNVLVKGSLIGTVTDFDGRYTLNAPEPTDTLVFSFVGFETREIPIEGRSTIDVVLSADVASLEELVVVGYGTMRREDLTGAVSQVEAQDLTNVVVSSTSELLPGRVPGLMTKQTTGLPGEGQTSLRVRGFGDPLVLVDGIEMSLDYIDPNDIESISVLKDASAAIYGARAGDGVILVTTKRGKHGKPVISVRSNVSFQQPTVLVDQVNAGEYAELLREGQLNAGVGQTYTDEEVEHFINGDPGYESYDWLQETFLDWAPMNDHSISVTGGNEDVRYFLSGGILNQNSAYRSGDYTFRRYNVRSNIDAYISEHLTASLNLSARSEERNQANTSQHGIFQSVQRVSPMYNPHLPDGRPAFGGWGGENPLARSDRDITGFRDEMGTFVEGSLALDYTLPQIKGLSAEARLSYRYGSENVKSHQRQYELYEYDAENDEYIFVQSNGSSTLNQNDEGFQWISPRLSAKYDYFSSVHSFSGLVLAEWIDQENRSLSAFRRDLISPEIPFLFAGSVDGIDNNEGMNENGRASYVGRIQYGYRERYRIEATARADATHKFPKDSRWGFFPSISGSWTVTEEPFFNVDGVDQLRLRLSYGLSGNDNVAAFRYLSGYSIRQGNMYVIGDQVYSLISEEGMPNPNITWLDMTSYNIGLDLSMWKERLSAEINLFQRTTDGIFGAPRDRFPSTFGADLPELNINKTQDRGIELMLSHNNSIGELGYSVTSTLGYSREKAVEWSEAEYTDEDEIRIMQREGHYTNRFIGYVSDGLFMSQEEIDNHTIDQDGAGNTTLRPGDIRYVDLNGDGEITWRDQKDIGRGEFPDLTFGLSIGLDYKAFNVSALFQGASLFNLNMTGAARGAFDENTTPHRYFYKYRWQPDPNDPSRNINPNAKLPAIGNPGEGANPNNNKTSDFWLRDATYIRLKHLSITYTLPTRLLSGIGISGMSLTASGSNLFMINRLGVFKGSFDPEVPQTGRGAYPPVRTVSMGVNVRF